MLCKYAPECTKSKNDSTAMCDRPATSVSFYQCATPINGPPVAGKNGITYNMITCLKYGPCGHRSPLCPKDGDKGFQGMQFLFTQYMPPPIFRTVNSPFMNAY